MNHHDVKILCAGESTIARLERGVWRCQRCGKQVQVVLPDCSAIGVGAAAGALLLLAFAPRLGVYALLAIATPFALAAAYRAGRRLRIPFLERSC